MKTISEFKFIREANKRFGKDKMKWKVVCPVCGAVQTPQDFRDAGIGYEMMTKNWGVSCIGRFTGIGNGQKGCHYTVDGMLVGMIRMHALEIEDEHGNLRPFFELAP